MYQIWGIYNVPRAKSIEHMKKNSCALIIQIWLVHFEGDSERGKQNINQAVLPIEEYIGLKTISPLLPGHAKIYSPDHFCLVFTGAHHRIYLTYMFILTIPREGPHQRIVSQGGGGHQGIGSLWEGHIVGSDPPGRTTTGDQRRIWISQRIWIYIWNSFRVWIRGLWDEFWLKKPRAKNLVPVSLSAR